jgi:hypothetical protein
MAAEDHIGDIWSTRIQQELLSLTTDNGDSESTSETRSILPPFTTVKEHTLDLTAGTCTVTVHIDVVWKKGVNDDDDNGEETEENLPLLVVVELDASLKRNMDGSLNSKKPSYPFVAPIARLKSGKSAFPIGSTIDEGDRINMDLDWTPSLHLVDVIMNIGLKIRESILQAEPFHAAEPEDPIAEVVADVTRGARRFASKLGSIGKAFTPKASTTPRKSQSTSGTDNVSSGSADSPKISMDDLKIGDEINLLEEPWIGAHGVYSCKAIRRPPFIEQAIQAHGQKKDEQLQYSSPTAVFRSLTQSARSVMEESFLMVTETHIIELRTSKLNMQMGTVVLSIKIDFMAKLKFRREESVSLFFKMAPEDPLIYICPHSGDAVHQIQSVLKRKGVRGKHTNAAAYRAINEALEMVQAIQAKETALQHEPTLERVNEIMDLYRQTAEKFESAGDIRHEEVVMHMRKFLAKPTTISILDGSYTKPMVAERGAMNELQDEVINSVGDGDCDRDDDRQAQTRQSSAVDKQFVENIDNLLREVKTDFDRGNVEEVDDDHYDLDGSAPKTDFTSDDIDELAADLDAMMKEADKELAELMSS